MTKVDIFAQAKEKVMPSWASFKNAGDSAQGTYIGKIVGQIDGYGNEQVIYQLLQDNGSVMNVGFGLNKKFIIQDMAAVKWGQIIGFKYKGMVEVPDKRRPGNMINVKDFGLHQDIKIVNQAWLDENKDSMPEVTFVTEQAQEQAKANAQADEDFENIGKPVSERNDVPFDSEPAPAVTGVPVTPTAPVAATPEVAEAPVKEAEVLTEEDKLAVIEKLAKDKLGSADLETSKTAVMEKLKIAFIPVNYDSIIFALKEI